MTLTSRRMLNGLLGGAGSYDPAAAAIFNAFTTPPTTARKALINAVVVSLKAKGIWTLFDVLYILAAADAQAARVNWKNPATFTASLINSPVFVADRGFTGDGSTSYIDSGFNPTTATSPNYTQNSAHLAFWSGTDVANTNYYDIGGQVGGSNMRFNCKSTTTNQLRGAINDGAIANFGTVTQPDSLGLYVLTRTGSAARAAYGKGALLSADAQASVAVASLSVSVLASQTSLNFSARRGVAASVGGGLTAQNVSDFNAALQPYVTALGAG